MAQGRVRVNGRLVRDAAQRVDLARDAISVDEAQAPTERQARRDRVYLALNKPRGLVTTRSDPQGRPTVFSCLNDAALPQHLSAVGRLDKASEGLLLLTNDTRWAARLTDPASHVDKVYHVQIGGVVDEALLRRMESGVDVSPADGEPQRLAVKRGSLLRSGGRTSWLEIVLDEGRNRHIRRLLDSLGMEVRRLLRVAIGPLQLGDLAKGAFRHLTAAERAALDDAAGGRQLSERLP